MILNRGMNSAGGGRAVSPLRRKRIQNRASFGAMEPYGSRNKIAGVKQGNPNMGGGGNYMVNGHPTGGPDPMPGSMGGGMKKNRKDPYGIYGNPLPDYGDLGPGASRGQGMRQAMADLMQSGDMTDKSLGMGLLMQMSQQYANSNAAGNGINIDPYTPSDHHRVKQGMTAAGYDMPAYSWGLNRFGSPNKGSLNLHKWFPVNNGGQAPTNEPPGYWANQGPGRKPRPMY